MASVRGPKALTLAHLRVLARLHRRGIEGADEALLTLARDRSEEVALLLGVVPERLERALHLADGAARIASTIDATSHAAKNARHDALHAAAAAVARRLAQTAEVSNEGCYVLDVALLGEALALHPGRILTLGERGSLSAGKVRALLREVRALHMVAALVTRDHLTLTYRGALCRGTVRLVLHAPVDDPDALLIPLGCAPLPEGPSSPPSDVVIAAPVTIHEGVEEDVPREGVEVPSVPVPPQRPFLAHLLDAVRDLSGASL